VGLSLSQHDQDAQPVQRHRMERLRTFSPEQMAAGLIWLSGYDPRTFDAVLDAAEPCPGDEDLYGREPEPVCGLCGAAIGIFLRLGLEWRHYRETRDTATREGEQGSGGGFGRIELFDPGHAPTVTWRLFDKARGADLTR
jgi:hypothetical protein